MRGSTNSCEFGANSNSTEFVRLRTCIPILTCEQVFVYSAEISNGCIVGYLFLKCYGLQLDASRDCLVDTLAEYSEPTVLREVGTDPNLPSLLIDEAPGGV